MPDSIVEALDGKCVAIVGLPAMETERLCVALERAQARAIPFELTHAPDAVALRRCDLSVTYVRPGGGDSPWLHPTSSIGARPTILVGHRDDLAELAPAIQAAAADFLMDSWQPEEALVRLSLAVAPRAYRKSLLGPAVPSGGRTRVLVADDDSIVLSLVRTALENFGMECFLAAEGPKALEAARNLRPQAAILDVNMPGMDGYEVLAALRNENLPIRVMLLTARQQENDVIRGFALGADDYMVKPFSPLELVARLKRLVLR
jgi:CheY-like chemotaxis protein